MLFEMVHSQFSNTPATYRKRVTKLELEGKAEVTALACALSQYQKEVLVLLSKVPTKHNSKSVKHTTPYQVPLWKSSQAKFPMCKNRWRKVAGVLIENFSFSLISIIRLAYTELSLESPSQVLGPPSQWRSDSANGAVIGLCSAG